jgi:hypothetical protein
MSKEQNSSYLLRIIMEKADHDLEEELNNLHKILQDVSQDIKLTICE